MAKTKQRKFEVYPHVRDKLEMSKSNKNVDKNKVTDVIRILIDRLEDGYYEDKIMKREDKQTVTMLPEEVEILRKQYRAYGYTNYNDFVEDLVDFELNNNWERIN